jgi:rod shape-determining protein MreC
MYRKSTRHRLVLAALLAATATVVTLDFRENPGGPIKRVQDLAVTVIAPLQDGMGQVFQPIGDFLSNVSRIGGLRKENAQLKSEVKELQSQQGRIPEILRENAELRGLANIKDWATGRFMAARVIGQGPSNSEWTAFLDKGTAEGLKVGMAVVTDQGLVGRTLIVAEHYSKVLLLIDPQHSVGSRLTGTGETGVISGRAQQDLLMEFIDPKTPIKDGETVVTSGYDRGVYPAGIPIGRVTRVHKASDGLTKNAEVKPLVDFTRLSTVAVLLESGPIR